VVALDLGVAWSGPYCAALLRDLGAHVIRVARPSAATSGRASGSTCAGVSSDLRADKELVELDLATGTGRDRFLALVSDADLIVQNFSPRVMSNLGLAPAELRTANPSLVTIAMPAFAAGSPWSQHIAYGGGLECATGLADFERGPLPRPASVPYLDYLAGAYASIAALSLLRARDRSGLGGDAVVAQQAVAGRVLHAAGADADGARYHPEPFMIAIASDLIESGFIRPNNESHRHRSRPPWSLAVEERVSRRAGVARRATRGWRDRQSVRLG
jgi:crotonobetainyl-CoA:carnitine CoA-transferase CaiB-like acyl-CoA transferase